jgi:hypothetical protein
MPMRISIQRGLLADFVGRLAGGIQKSNSALDEGKYVLLCVSDGKMVGMVNGRDIFAKVVLDSKLVDDKDILEISGEGEYAVDGTYLVRMVTNSKIDGLVDISFEDSNDGFVKKEGEDYEGLLKAVGALRICSPGLAGTKKQVNHLQCVEQPKPGPCEPDVDNHVAVPAKELLDLATKVGVAAGKNSASLDYSQIMVRTVKNSQEMELATHDGYEIGWAKFKVEKTGSVFGVVPYETLMSICRMVDKEDKVSISNTKTGAKGLLFEQEYKFGGNVVGKTKYCARSVSDKFVEFEKIIKNLSFKFTCVANLENARHVANCLEAIDSIKTSVSFSPSEKTLTFSKACSMVRSQDIVLPLTKAEGEALELEFSSRILKKAVDNCDREYDEAKNEERAEIEIRFSGKRSLGTIRLSKACKLFFAPFAEG